MNLLEFCKTKTDISDELALELDAKFVKKSIAKKEQILPIGNLSKNVFYLEKGLIRVYFEKDGKDITHFFFTEGSLCLPIESVFYDTESSYAFEALEDCELRVADFRVIDKFLKVNMSLQELMQKLLIEVITLFSVRLNSLQFLSAKERYAELLQIHPDIIHRAPLGHIASYLGITQQTLSVIRAEKA